MSHYKAMSLPNGDRIAVMNKTEAGIIYREIFEDDIYAFGDLEIRDGDVVIDIGANIGLFLRYAKSFGEAVSVYSFEPIPETFAVLQENARSLGENIFLFNQGVSGQPGTAIFRHLPRFSCSSSMCPDDSEEQRQRAEEFTLNVFDKLENPLLATAVKLIPSAGRRALARAINRHHQKSVDIECQLTTVSDIIRDNGLTVVDYLKLDAEGAEIDVLSGIDDEHWGMIKQIAIETHHGDEKLKAVLNIVEERGFVAEVDYSPQSPLDGMVYCKRR